MITVGIDEVGRGCWAGPLVAAAVILDEPIIGLRDSKLLTKNQRKVLAKEIYQKSVVVCLGWVDAKTIDAQGLSAANQQAMQHALDQITTTYDEVVIDGNYNYLADNPKVRTLVKADSLVPAVSAASIVAKVARDAFMTDAAMQYPEYGFERHAGYGTAFHHEMIQLHGVCELHRISYKPIQALLRVKDVKL